MTESCSFGGLCRSHTHHDKREGSLQILAFDFSAMSNPGFLGRSHIWEGPLPENNIKTHITCELPKRWGARQGSGGPRRKATASNPNSCKGPKHRLYLNCWHQPWEAGPLRSVLGMEKNWYSGTIRSLPAFLAKFLSGMILWATLFPRMLKPVSAAQCTSNPSCSCKFKCFSSL